uniref:Uncharacterized protein n=1 Tax=Rhizophora mucronata TaxID=61149 RepID=A0A2P2P5I2_RHIMU
MKLLTLIREQVSTAFRAQ